MLKLDQITHWISLSKKVFLKYGHSESFVNTCIKRSMDKKTNPKITILEILAYKIQPEIIKSKIFTHFNFITNPCSQEWNYQQNVQIKQVKLKCPIKR